jgi:DNA-binding response OmpR family regulator
MRVLIIEDDADVVRLIGDDLRRASHTVDALGSLEDGLYAAGQVAYDLFVIDRRLPDGDGIGLVRRLRAGGQQAPILMLTAQRQVSDRVAGLEAGADDYLVKPFALAELRARVNALLRRPPALSEGALRLGNVVFDPTHREARVDDRPIMLSRRELALLELLMRRARHVMPKSAIEETLYGFDEALASNTIEVHIHNLRRALQRHGATVLIETRRGIGYRLTESAGE